MLPGIGWWRARRAASCRGERRKGTRRGRQHKNSIHNRPLHALKYTENMAWPHRYLSPPRPPHSPHAFYNLLPPLCLLRDIFIDPGRIYSHHCGWSTYRPLKLRSEARVVPTCHFSTLQSLLSIGIDHFSMCKARSNKWSHLTTLVSCIEKMADVC